MSDVVRMVDKHNLSPIGIGGWGIGGFAQMDPKNDDKKQVNARAYQLSKGINFVELNFWNSQGKSVQLIQEAMERSGVKRGDLFLLLSIYNYDNPTLDDVRKEFERCLTLFNGTQIDSIQFPLTAIRVYGFNPLVKLVQSYLDQRLVRFTSITNFNLEYLKKYHDVFGKKIFSHELHYSFEIRVNEDLGIIDFANKHGIINVLYQPLRRNRTAKRHWELLEKLSKKYGKTQNQILLRWLTARGFHPLVKSETIEHIDGNLDALKFEMELADIRKMDSFRPPNYRSKDVDWWMDSKNSEKTAYMHALPNIFDEEYDKMTNEE